MTTKHPTFYNVKSVEKAKKHNATEVRKIRQADVKIESKREKIEQLKKQITKTEDEIRDLEKYDNVKTSYVFDEDDHYSYSEVLDLSRVEKVAILPNGQFHITIFKIDNVWYKVETRLKIPEDTNSGFTSKLLELTDEELYWS